MDNSSSNHYNEELFINTSSWLMDSNQTGIFSDEPAYLTTFKLVIKWLNLYYLGFIVIVGILGNGYNFISFLRSNKDKRSSPSYYLASLALADTVFLVTILIVWIGHLGINLFFWKHTFFFILTYLGSASSCMSGKLFY